VLKQLHKNGNRCEVSNYRPVSLLKSFSKIFQIVIQTRILKQFNKCNILSNEQYGFRIGLKKDNAIYKLTTVSLNVMNNKQLVEGIFCDLEKEFDCVDHDILLSELKFYGVLHFIILIWITDILEQQCIMTAITVIKFQAGLI
jgi:hypothetical protein